MKMGLNILDKCMKGFDMVEELMYGLMVISILVILRMGMFMVVEHIPTQMVTNTPDKPNKINCMGREGMNMQMEMCMKGISNKILCRDLEHFRQRLGIST